MAKYKIYVNGNNASTQTTAPIVQQLAQNAANQQIQAQAQNDAANDLRTTVEDIVKTKLLTPVNVPKFTTVQDILDAQKGQRLETFGKYLGNNPDITRLIGTIVGGTYMDRNGNFITGGEDQAQRQEAQMRADQAKAIQEQKEQNDLTQAMANAYNQRDIAEENNKMRRELAEQELQFRKEENALDRALKREGMANSIKYANIIHGGGGGSATGGAAGMTKEEKEKYDSANLIYNQLNALQDEFDKLPQSTAFKGTQKGKALQTGWSNKVGLRNDNVAGFMAIRNPLTSQLARTIGGEKGVLTDRDFERASAMLPSEFDSPQQAAAKMKAVKNLVAARYGITDNMQIQNNTAMPNFDKNKIEAEMKRRGLNKNGLHKTIR